MKIGVYPGTFDPMTNGHLHILKEASALFDKVYIAVLTNSGKSPVFSVEERLSMLREVIASEGLSNVETDSFGGLLVSYCREKGAEFIVRGLRTVSDFEYESGLDAVNRHMAPEIKTVYFMAALEQSFVSSSYIREMGHYGADISGLVPSAILNTISERLNQQ